MPAEILFTEACNLEGTSLEMLTSEWGWTYGRKSSLPLPAVTAPPQVNLSRPHTVKDRGMIAAQIPERLNTQATHFLPTECNICPRIYPLVDILSNHRTDWSLLSRGWRCVVIFKVENHHLSEYLRSESVPHQDSSSPSCSRERNIGVDSMGFQTRSTLQIVNPKSGRASLDQISRSIESAEETRGLIQNIERLEK